MEDTEESETNFAEQSTWLLGYVSLFQMTRLPHSEWYESGFRNYRFDENIAEKIRGVLPEEISITIVLGTWCPDSRREVPRFMRLLNYLKFPEEKLTFIGVDNVKLSPITEYEALNIERVPTFIFYKNNIEIGRIIEVPVTSLEQDMLNILRGNKK
ncbi:MAG TPA: thioredoxin family protein [Bacteroidales bacterium]|nr:thioredoxin family protein [Bacteroidales bacterium]